jgi:hypothetical protein
MEDTQMESIVEKALKQIEQLEERATVLPNTPASKLNTSGKNAKVKVQVDTSDEANDSYTENEDIFSAFNQQSNVSSLRVDVQIDEDVEEDPDDAIAEGGEDTVYGQGTPPNPKDETYLSLLKGTAPKSNKIKVKVKD